VEIKVKELEVRCPQTQPKGQHELQNRGLNTWTRGSNPRTPCNSHTGYICERFDEHIFLFRPVRWPTFIG